MDANIWFHIDVNSAFLSWTAIELLKAGAAQDIREIPSIIGGDMTKRHGVVLAKSTPAKAFGIKTGEPVTDAYKKCPHLKNFPPNHHKYEEYSKRMMRLLSRYSPELVQYSIDECFFRYMPQGATDIRLNAVANAHKIKDRIKTELGFTVNIGISENKLLAKMASDFKKPDRVHTLFQNEIQKKMWPLPVGELFMVGHSTAERLRLLGIKTIGDLAKTDVSILTAHLKSHGKTIWEFANGIEGVPIDGRAHTENKGVGNMTTLSEDLSNKREIFLLLRELSERRRRHRLGHPDSRQDLSVWKLSIRILQKASNRCSFCLRRMFLGHTLQGVLSAFRGILGRSKRTAAWGPYDETL